MGHGLVGPDADAELDVALRVLTPADLTAGRRWVSAADLARLTEDEAEQIRHAVPRRRQEFASGRVLLRELLGRDVPIPVAVDRSPVLPPGFCGSLAHDDDVVVAAVSAVPSVLSIGIDVEPATPLEADVGALVLRPDEPGIDAHLAFTMKEAAYKAWSGLGGPMLDHHDVRLTMTTDAFRAEIMTEGIALDGSWITAGGRWLALVVVRDAASGARRHDAAEGRRPPVRPPCLKSAAGRWTPRLAAHGRVALQVHLLCADPEGWYLRWSQ
jgi:4'-phosphopantetheinyl transferase EntD